MSQGETDRINDDSLAACNKGKTVSVISVTKGQGVWKGMVVKAMRQGT